jgi:hypothetical protein
MTPMTRLAERPQEERVKAAAVENRKLRLSKAECEETTQRPPLLLRIT